MSERTSDQEFVRLFSPRILERLADLSRPFGTIVEVKGDIAAIKLRGVN
jgi:hypothetical protein